MKIHFSSLGNFIPADFNMTSEHANEFIPLVCGQNMSVKDGIQYYSKPSFEKHLRKPNTLKNIKDGFELGGTTRRIEINGRVFFIAKGVFFSEAGVPLMVCAMKKEAFLDPLVSKFSDFRAENFSYNNYVLFYSTSFFTDPGLTPLNRRLQKEILQTCYEKGIEVRTITSLEIEKNTFARLFEVKKTKSLTQLEAYMEQVLPNFLHNEGEDTFIEKEFEPITLAHEEGLSVEDEALLFDNDSTPVTETVVQAPVIPNRQLTLEEVIEMAELEAEAAQFDSDLEPSDEEEYTDEEYNEDWENDEQDEDEEEIERHEEAAHTVYPYTPLNAFIDANGNTITNVAPQTAESLVEIMRPLQDAYNMQMLQAQQRGQLQAEREAVRSWHSVIELIDDTE
jgi:hypothetical protein